jgi:hypothetical protein
VLDEGAIFGEGEGEGEGVVLSNGYGDGYIVILVDGDGVVLVFPPFKTKNKATPKIKTQTTIIPITTCLL